ncbi:Nucleoporin nup84 [Trapelia coarctata]|nr:Nucleoporin nup84 [Trapelia coarctata]
MSPEEIWSGLLSAVDANLRRSDIVEEERKFDLNFEVKSSKSWQRANVNAFNSVSVISSSAAQQTDNYTTHSLVIADVCLIIGGLFQMGSRARHTIREESWDSLHYSDASNESSPGDESESSINEQGIPALRTVGDVQRAIYPLKATADRVGKQVERFAETLDRLNTQKQRKSKDCRHVLPIVYEYERIAGVTVDRLRKVHQPDREVPPRKPQRNRRRRSRSSSGRSTPISIHEDEDEDGISQTSLQDLKDWEEERQTWRLLWLMLELEYPPSNYHPYPSWHEEHFTRPSKHQPTHQYSSDQDVWENFLAEHSEAWEKNVIVEWLKIGAEETSPDINALVNEDEPNSDKRSGLWSHGWLHTKEAIKNVKELRSWPLPLDPNSPGIDTALANPDGTHLVTQLDPDAFTRQGRTISQADVSRERATWQACWEMLRRGRSWETVRDWCQGRVEGWKALAMHGDPRGSSLGAWHSRALWRSICLKAAKNGGIDPYENAVYGALSGDILSVEKVVRSCDDYLFAHYNSYLLQSFDFYIERKFSGRLPVNLKERLVTSSIADAPFMDVSPLKLVQRMRNMDPLKAEATNPTKMLQASLISRGFKTFIQNTGLKLAQSANQPGRSKLMKVSRKTLEPDLGADITFDDYDLLRILTHMILIFQDLDPAGYKSHAVENIVVAYIDFLGKAGKHQLMPLYASRLSEKRSIRCMGRQLPFIIDPSERETVMRLMKQYGLDVQEILKTQIVMIMDDTSPNVDNSTTFPNLDILDHSRKPKAMPTVRKNFSGESMTEDEKDLVNGFEWYLLLDGHWPETMSMGTMLYKHLLRIKALAAAKYLAETVNFSAISLNKTKTILGRALDLTLSQPASEDEANGNLDLRRSTRSRSTHVRNRRSSSSRKRLKAQRGLLLSHSQSFRDLENLVVALDTLEYWKEKETEAVQQEDPRHAREWKAEMQQAHDAVVTTMQPILHGWLQCPKDDAEAAEFEAIRVAILPELTLAYGSVLNFGGHALSREILLQCMDLAATVASEQSDLANCFTKAGRMSEFVDSMAVASKSLLRAEEIGRKANRKARKLDGENMGIWDVKTPRDRALELGLPT